METFLEAYGPPFPVETPSPGRRNIESFSSKLFFFGEFTFLFL